MKNDSLSSLRRYVLCGYSDERIAEICECSYAEIAPRLVPIRETFNRVSKRPSIQIGCEDPVIETTFKVANALEDLAERCEFLSEANKKYREDENHDKRVKELQDELEETRYKRFLYITKEEWQKGNEWALEHRGKTHHSRIEYVMVPTHLGMAVKVRCPICYHLTHRRFFRKITDYELTLREIGD